MLFLRLYIDEIHEHLSSKKYLKRGLNNISGVHLNLRLNFHLSNKYIYRGRVVFLKDEKIISSGASKLHVAEWVDQQLILS